MPVLLDQVVVALLSAGVTLTALVSLPRSDSGEFIVWASVASAFVSLNRAWVGEVLLVITPTARRGAYRRELVNAVSTSLVNGFAIAFCIMLAGSLLSAVFDRNLTVTAFAVAVAVPLLLWHDSVRFCLLATMRPGFALIVDAVALATFVTAILIATQFQPAGKGLIFLCWGASAACAATLFMLSAKIYPSARPWLTWFRHHRRLGSGFTGAALVAQLHAQALNGVLVGLVSTAALSGIRGTQTLVVQPVQNLGLATTNFLVPRYARVNKGSSEELKSLRSRAMRTSPFLAFLVLLILALPGYLLANYLGTQPKFRDMSDLVLPCVVQASLAFAHIPGIAALRAMKRSGSTIGQATGFALVNISFLAVGLVLGGVSGGMWGLVLGTAAGTSITFALLVRATSVR